MSPCLEDLYFIIVNIKTYIVSGKKASDYIFPRQNTIYFCQLYSSVFFPKVIKQK